MDPSRSGPALAETSKDARRALVLDIGLFEDRMRDFLTKWIIIDVVGVDCR